jgi:hypothetical protein
LFLFCQQNDAVKGFGKENWWIGTDGVHLLAFRFMQIVLKVQRQPEEESELYLLSMQGPAVPN